MKWSIIILSIVIILVSCKTKEGIDGNFLQWKNTSQLVFKDFKGKPIQRSKHMLGRCETECIYKYTIEKDTKLPKFVIKCFFNKKMSFIRKKKDTLTLRHEQIHFNIRELFCRRTRKSWDSLNKLKVSKIAVYNSIRNKNLKQINVMDDRFDEEEVDIPEEEVALYYDSILRNWERKIENELLQLVHYSD